MTRAYVVLLFVLVGTALSLSAAAATTTVATQYSNQDLALMQLIPLPTFYDDHGGTRPVPAFSCSTAFEYHPSDSGDDGNDHRSNSNGLATSSDHTCDEVAVDFSISQTLSKPFEKVGQFVKGYLYLHVRVSNTTGEALQAERMKLIIGDDGSIRYHSGSENVAHAHDSVPHSSGSEAHFFHRTMVFVPPSDNNKPNVAFDVKIPLTAHAKITNLPRVLRFRVEKGSSRRPTPIAVAYSHDTVQLSAHYFRNYFNAEYGHSLQRYLSESNCPNVLLFGQMGSGKSTTLNSIISALSDRVRRVAEAGGGLKHHTQKFMRYRLNNIVDDVCINMFDTWGLGDGKWDASVLFQSIVKGILPVGHRMQDAISDELINATLSNKDPQTRKIHAVLLFLSADAAFDTDIVRQIYDTIEVAMQNDINPVIVVTMAQDKSDRELESIITHMQDIFRCPIFINDVYTEHMMEKVHGIDQNALTLLDIAFRAASDHLAKRGSQISDEDFGGKSSITTLSSLAYVMQENVIMVSATLLCFIAGSIVLLCSVKNLKLRQKISRDIPQNHDDNSRDPDVPEFYIVSGKRSSQD